MRGWFVLLQVAVRLVWHWPGLLWYLLPRRWRGGWKSPWQP
ncbi:MAG: hypothetical protein ACOX9B_14950 [Candidatus Xenobium sp.]